MVDGRTKLSADVEREARRHLGEQVYTTTVPRNIRLSEAPSHGVPIHRYRPSSPGAAAYRALAAEIRGRDATTEVVAQAPEVTESRPLVPVMASAGDVNGAGHNELTIEIPEAPSSRAPVGVADR
jgi:nitrogenase subunit NifH